MIRAYVTLILTILAGENRTRRKFLATPSWAEVEQGQWVGVQRVFVLRI
jgi:hypothetical protein